jgi:hypothetical protein
MGDFGHSFAFEKFGYQRLVKDMENLYDLLLSKN